jgi:O-antigen ligase
VKSAYSTPVRTAVVWQPGAALVSPSSPIAGLGFVLFSIYLLSGFANDWSLHLFGVKAYLSAVTLALLPLAWIFSGQALRGLRTRTGKFWAAFLLWMLLAAPFSMWRGGSAALLMNYIPRAYMCFFFACSFANSLGRCRQLMQVQIVSGAALLLSCFLFGGLGDDPGETRFRIPHSLFYANSNDLALALLLAVTSFLFLLASPRILPRLAGAAGILIASVYVLKTGSRGSVVAASSLLCLIFCLSRTKWKVLAFGVAAIAVLIAANWLGAPSATLHRLSLVLDDPASSLTESSADIASVASQDQRQELFLTSLRYTLLHPLLGVGPDQFTTAMEADAVLAGRHTPWLGTHNSYTQISSECGIPALIFYLAVIVSCVRSNFRLYLRTRDHPALQNIAALSRSLLAGVCVYAVSAFFFHMAYSANLPLLAGFTVALQLARANPPRVNSFSTIAPPMDTP